MKWAIGPRRVGKTEVILNSFLNHYSDCILIIASIGMRRDITSRIQRSKNIKYNGNYYIQTIENKTIKKYLFTYDQYIERLKTDPQLKEYDKFIDESGYILESIFNNVKVVSGTGPNYSWSVDMLNKIEEFAKSKFNNVTEKDIILHEFTEKWDKESN